MILEHSPPVSQVEGRMDVLSLKEVYDPFYWGHQSPIVFQTLGQITPDRYVPTRRFVGIGRDCRGRKLSMCPLLCDPRYNVQGYLVLGHLGHFITA